MDFLDAKRRAGIFFLALAAVYWGYGYGAMPAAATGPGYIEVTAPELKTMLEEKKAMVLINALSRIEYEGLHIPGSINIPVVDMAETDRLPTDKKTPLVFYCMGEK